MKTVIYYTSNREHEKFEGKIRQVLLETCDYPIISVSQKPINLGENICVGNHTPSTYNTKKQIYEGLKKAKTKYVIMAEADFLYPREYFDFEPKKDRFYCVRNIYVLWINQRVYFRKVGSEGAMICHREMLMDNMESYLKGWDEKIKMKSILFNKKTKWIWLSIPAVTFKTGKGVSWRCPHRRVKFRSIPGWGKAAELRARFCEFV